MRALISERKCFLRSKISCRQPASRHTRFIRRAGTWRSTNDNWADTQQAEIQASGYAPPGNKESAIIITRPSANTTAIVRGKNNTTGNALVEVYALAQ